VSNMFNFMNMIGNYKERKVERDEFDEIIVDTAAVTDSDEPYETGISRDGDVGTSITVKLYVFDEDEDEN